MKTGKKSYPRYYIGLLVVVLMVYYIVMGHVMAGAVRDWSGNRMWAALLFDAMYACGAVVVVSAFSQLFGLMQKQALFYPFAPKILALAAFCLDVATVALLLLLGLMIMTLGHRPGYTNTIGGWLALVPLLLVFLYFYIPTKYLGGTFGRHALGVAQSRKE